MIAQLSGSQSIAARTSSLRSGANGCRRRNVPFRGIYFKFHVAVSISEAPTILRLKQRAISKSGHRFCRTNVFVCPEIALQFIEEGMIFSPTRSHFGGSCVH